MLLPPPPFTTPLVRYDRTSSLGKGLISLPNEKRQDRPHAIFSDIEAGAKSSYSEIIVGPPLNHHKNIYIEVLDNYCTIKIREIYCEHLYSCRIIILPKLEYVEITYNKC
jgi:hypothetical protein